MSDKNEIEEQARIIIKLTNLIGVLVILLAVALILLVNYIPSFSSVQKTIEAPLPDSNGLFTDVARQVAKVQLENSKYWVAPDESSLNSDPKKKEILYGKDLIVHTSEYYGENGSIARSVTNGMNCQNCHLEAGTKIFGNNYSAVAATYPKYRARSGALESIYKRVNDCFERSLNGKALDSNSKEMKAIASYIYWLGKKVEKGKRPEGVGFKDLSFLDRAADPEKGKMIYSEKCKTCHQADGEGLLNNNKTAYTYPPLWGDHSYNDGAGLFRISNFARYAKYNMPDGADHNSPQLSDEEAWDVAAFVNSQNRPHYSATGDWPKLNEKPFDLPFGPYTDAFSEKRHKFGPYPALKNKP